MSFRRRKTPSPVVGPVSHSGWLRKQGSKFKTWSKRYFVLEGHTMHYYQREDRQNFIGSFSVKGHDLEIIDLDVNYSRSSSTETDKFMFLIKPGESQCRVSENHEYFLLCASSKEERTQWVKVIQKAMYRERGGAIFGYPLDEVMESALTDPNDKVPIVVKDCCDYILNYGVKQEGIFRKCVRKKAIRDLIQSYDRGLRPILLQCSEVHTVSCVLKRFLSELPEPLIPYAHYDLLKAAGYYITENCEVSTIIQRLEELPRSNYVLLKYLCQFLHKVASHSHVNRMSTKNLASVFAPHILRCQDSDPNIDASATQLINTTVEAFITHHEVLFVKTLQPSVPITSNELTPRDPCAASSSDLLGDSLIDSSQVIHSETPLSPSSTPAHRVSFRCSPQHISSRNSNSLPSKHNMLSRATEPSKTPSVCNSLTAPSHRRNLHEITTAYLSVNAPNGGSDSPVTLRIHPARRSASVLPASYRYSDDTNTDCEREEDEDVVRAIQDVTRRMLQLSRERSELQKERDYYRASCSSLQQHNQLLLRELRDLKIRLSQKEEEVCQLRASHPI